MLRSAHGTFAVFSAEGHCLFATEPLAALLGRPLERVEGAQLEGLVPAALAERWRADIRSALEGREQLTNEVELSFSGTLRSVRYLASRLPVPAPGAESDEAAEGTAELPSDLVLFELEDVTERRRTEGEAADLAHRLRVLSEASRTLAGATGDVRALMREICALVVSAVGDTCLASLLTEDGKTLEYLTVHHRDPSQLPLVETLLAKAPPTAGEGFTREVLETGRAVFLPRLDAESYRQRLGPEQREAFERIPFHSLMMVPLDIAGRRRGVLTSVRHGGPPFTERDLSLLQDLAERAGLAAGRAVLFDLERRARLAAEQAAAREARLQAYTAALAACADEESVMRVGLHGSLRAANADAGAVFSQMNGGNRALLILAEGVSADVARALRYVSTDPSHPLGRALQERRALYMETPAAVRAAAPELADERVPLASSAVATLPLLSGDRVLGALSLGFTQAHPFSPEERVLLESLALQCAVALERVRLLAAERTRLEHRLFLAEAGELLSRTLDADRVLEDLAQQAVPRIGDWCAIDMLGPEGSMRQAAVAHTDPARAAFAREFRRKYPPEKEGADATSEVLRTGKPLLVPHVPEEALVAGAQSPEHLADLRRLGIRSFMVVPLQAGGETFGALTLVWSESERRYTEEDLRFATELGQRAAQAYQNARLYRDLQAAVDARDEFLAMAGHELKTPLTALLLQLQNGATIAKAIPDAPLSPRVVKALRAASRLDKLVSQLLDVSRITGARLTLDPEPGDFDEIVREAAMRLLEPAQAVGSPLQIRSAGAIPGVWDRLRLEQVVTNLISNALKYGHGKPIHVEVREESGGGLVEVRDHGIGIPPDQQARIFERFERAVAARAYGGLGLGLWITRQIVESAGGWVRVQSRPGEGATFTVWLPKEGPP